MRGGHFLFSAANGQACGGRASELAVSQFGLGRLPGDIVIERENMTLPFPARDVPAHQLAAQRGAVGREPLTRSRHYLNECRVPRVALSGEAVRVCFGATAALRPSSMPCRWAAAFSMS